VKFVVIHALSMCTSKENVLFFDIMSIIVESYIQNFVEHIGLLKQFIAEFSIRHLIEMCIFEFGWLN